MALRWFRRASVTQQPAAVPPLLTRVVEVDAAQVGEQVLQGFLAVAHGVHAVVGQHQRAQAGVQQPELPHL